MKKAPLAKTVAATDLKSVEETRAGSSPAGRTTILFVNEKIIWIKNELRLYKFYLIWDGRVKIALTPTEYKVMICAMASPGIFTINEMIEFIYAFKAEQLADPRERIRMNVSNLNKKLWLIKYRIKNIWSGRYELCKL